MCNRWENEMVELIEKNSSQNDRPTDSYTANRAIFFHRFSCLLLLLASLFLCRRWYSLLFFKRFAFVFKRLRFRYFGIIVLARLDSSFRLLKFQLGQLKRCWCVVLMPFCRSSSCWFKVVISCLSPHSSVCRCPPSFHSPSYHPGTHSFSSFSTVPATHKQQQQQRKKKKALWRKCSKT